MTIDRFLLTGYDGLSFTDSSDSLLSLAKRFAPTVYIHPDEGCFPSSVSWCLERSSLCFQSKIVLQKGMVTAENLVTQEISQISSGAKAFELGSFNWYLEVPGSAHQGQLPVNNEIHSECYVHIRKPLTSRVRDKNVADFQYWFFYPYNGKVGLGGLSSIGVHEGDWEHVTVRVNLDEEKIIGVYFSRHSDEDIWDLTGESWKEGGPVIYSAKASHASYAESGRHSRHLVDDDHTGKGAIWRTSEHLVLLDNDPAKEKGANAWNRFAGNWGASKGGGIGGSRSPECPGFKASWLDDGGFADGLFGDWSNVGTTPTMLVHEGMMYMCLLDGDSAIYMSRSNDGVNWSRPSRLFGDWSNIKNSSTPTMVSWGNELHMCLMSDRGAIYTSQSKDGIDWSAPQRQFGDWSNAGSTPNMLVHNNTLYMTLLTGNAAIYITQSGDGVEWSQPQRLFGDWSNIKNSSTPTMTSCAGKIIMCLMSDRGAIFTATSADGSIWSAPERHFSPWSNVGSTPTMVVLNNAIYMCLLNGDAAIFVTKNEDSTNSNWIQPRRIMGDWSNIKNHSTPSLILFEGRIHMCLMSDRGAIYTQLLSAY